MVMVGRMGVFEGVAVGVLRTGLVKKVGVMLGVAVKKNRAHGLKIPPPSVSPVGVAPVSGMKRLELIISRLFENPPVKSIGTIAPKIQIKSIPAVMTCTVCFALRFTTLLACITKAVMTCTVCFALTFTTLLACITKVDYRNGCDVMIHLRCSLFQDPLLTLCHKNGIKVHFRSLIT
jgi:hypothetical protein